MVFVVIKTRGTHGGRGDVFTGFWFGGPEARDHWKDLGISGKITLRWTLGRQRSMGRTEFSWLRIGSRVGFCEHGNETSDSIRKQDIFDKLSNNQLFK
jgi:hypothetical protein